MGNLCCGNGEEGYKQGGWYDDLKQDDEQNNDGESMGESSDDEKYNVKATDREKLIQLHDKAKVFLSKVSKNSDDNDDDEREASTKSEIKKVPTYTSLEDLLSGNPSDNHNAGKFTNKTAVIDRKAQPRTRKSITSTPFTINKDYVCPWYPKNPATMSFLLQSLNDNFIFDTMDDNMKLRLVHAMQHELLEKDKFVMKQGDVGDYFYVLGEGVVSFHVLPDDEELLSSGSHYHSKASTSGGDSRNSVIGRGSIVDNVLITDVSQAGPSAGIGTKGCTFGELALLYNTPRAASVYATTPLAMWKVDQVTFRSLLTHEQQKDRTKLQTLIDKVTIFKELDQNRRLKLLDAFSELEFRKDDRIVNKGDEGKLFYIVKSGEVRVHDIGHGKSQFQDQILCEGQSFGERALVTGETRAANITGISDHGSLLAISRDMLIGIIGPLEHAVEHCCRCMYLKSIPIFGNVLGCEEVDACARLFRKVKFTKGESVDATNKLYVIRKGSVLMMVKNENDHTKGPTLVKLVRGDYFGDIINDEENEDDREKAGNGTAGNGTTLPQSTKEQQQQHIIETDTEFLVLTTSDVKSVIGNLSRLSIGTNTNNNKTIQSLSRCGSTRLKRGSAKSKLKKITKLNQLHKHKILGVGTFGKVWLVTTKKGSMSHPPGSPSSSHPPSPGTPPHSSLHRSSSSPRPYALKMISKRQLLQSKLVSAVLREKNILESIEHPFLLHMVSSFQDEHYLFLLMDLVLGGELFELIYTKKISGSEDGEKDSSKGLGVIGVDKAVFYSACIIEAFAYLHNRKIAYRDLKPENVLIDNDGYCIMVDMGFAKVVLDKTYTMCGTPEYIAPEVIVSKGHNHVQDYWSYGCLLYELMVGQTPFFDVTVDQMSLLKRIVRANYTFPTDEDSTLNNSLEKVKIEQWKDLVSRLLVANSVERIGNLCNGIHDILNHNWFQLMPKWEDVEDSRSNGGYTIDFHLLREKRVKAPWVPRIENPMDTSHFSSDYGKEEQPEVFRHKLSEKDQEEFRFF